MKKKRMLLFAGEVLLITVLDRLSKAWITADPEGCTLIPGVLRLRLVLNTGVAFSFLEGMPLLTTILTALLLLGLLVWLIADRKLRPPARAGLIMVLSGGLGNLYDRILNGAVTDMIEVLFVRFAVFNVADAAICIGALLTCLSYLFPGRKGERYA